MRQSGGHGGPNLWEAVRLLSLPLRQRQTMELIVQGLSRDEAAHRLEISVGAIDANVRRAYARVGAHCVAEFCSRVFDAWIEHRWCTGSRMTENVRRGEAPGPLS